MAPPFRYRLSTAEKDALLSDQSALIDRQASVIADQQRRIAELEAGQGKPRKTSRNSHLPPSSDFSGKSGSGKGKSGKKKPRPSRAGTSRSLAAKPDETQRITASACPHCGADISGQCQGVRHRYDHIDIPPVAPHVTRIELCGGRCAGCKRRFKATPPETMSPGTPFGPGIHAFLLYLHHSHHVGYERLARLMREMFGLAISEGAIANAFSRSLTPLEETRQAIKAALQSAQVIASDETTTRINGKLHWHWTFVSDKAVYHEIAPSRGKAVAETVLGKHRPEVWISDRYAGQQDMADAHQVCLAHVLRDIQYAIDCGDTILAPKMRDLLLWTIGIARRRDQLADSTLAQYHAKAERRLDRLLGTRADHPMGRTLQAQVKAWRSKFFVFLTDRRVPPTNNGSEREIRPSVIHRKVSGGFRSEWGAKAHAGYRSAVSTAQRQGKTALKAIATVISGNGTVLPTT